MDTYDLPARTLCLTLCTLDSKHDALEGYLIAGVTTDSRTAHASNGHEYWIFRAGELSAGPIAKLFAPELNNATLFHGIYVAGGATPLARTKVSVMPSPSTSTYPKRELAHYPAAVRRVFEEQIYPRFRR